MARNLLSKIFRSRFGAALICSLALVAPKAAEASSKELKAQGAALFEHKGCAHCHGPAGFGGSDSGPDLSKVRKQLKPAEIAHQIHDGGKNMPPFGSSLTDEEIQSLVAYLHARRKQPPGWVKHNPQAAAPAPASKSDPD
jgi:ubiquinol-cytochrome c reductase cytochrome b subunit